ncbi:hypothetical protein, partial [Staphylococcus warneri]|uniref:hypothetical protein n=1 Tax=Staphylococcus warneri TaxID=1292 RepID=UPI001C987D74
EREVENGIRWLEEGMKDLDGKGGVSNGKGQGMEDIDGEGDVNDEEKSAMKDEVNEGSRLK